MRVLTLAAVAALAATGAIARGTTIWSSTTHEITFTKANGADFTLPANQDFMTPNVVITRGDNQGIYNVVTETAFNMENGGISVDNVSPEGTEWAFSSLNGNNVFDYGTGAANHASLIFADWETAAGGGGFPGSLVNNAAVVHLIADDIYLDLQFTDWGVGKSGQNGFSYMRAAPLAAVPEPMTLASLGLGAVLLLTRRKRSPGRSA